MNYIKFYTEITKNDISLVGGKGLSLGLMTNAGLPIPSGFIVTTEVYKKYCNQKLSNDAIKNILIAFDTLNTTRVAVRSSAIAEDSEITSWAGQLDTYLYITRENLIKNIKKCWNSINSIRASAYAQYYGISKDKMQIGVIVQKMINSDVSGVMFSINPITKNSDEIMIEAIFGLGELLVQGLVTPSNFIIDKKNFAIKSKYQGSQDKMSIFQNGKNKKILLPKKIKLTNILNDEELKILSEYAISIEKIYKKPQDIEWARENGSFFILQSRPVTAI